MSMPSSKVTLTSSVTDATSQSPPNTSQNSGLNVNNCRSPSPPSANTIYQKQTRVNNPVPSTSKSDIDKCNESLDCPNHPSHCSSSSLPLGHAKGYLCSCNSVADDPKPGPSTTAAEFDLEVFDSCSSCSLEDCWGPDCHHSSCESSPIAGSANTSVLIRSSGRNKSFHRKGNKRQLSSTSGVPERGTVGLGLNKPGTSSEIFPLGHSKPNTSVLSHNIIDRSKTTLGEFSDNSSEDDFIMSSPGRPIPAHGQHYEPTSACPSETEEATLSDGKEEDEADGNDDSLYRKSIQNHLSRHRTINVQELSNETSMDEINHDEVNQLTDVEEEEGQDEEIINAAAFRDNNTTSITSHNPELQKEHQNCTDDTDNGTECTNVQAECQTDSSKEHCNCYPHKSGPPHNLQPVYCTSGPECQEDIALTCHCSQTSTSDGVLRMQVEPKHIGNLLGDPSLPNAELPSLISCTSTTEYAHAESLDDHPTVNDANEQAPNTSGISSEMDPGGMSSLSHDQSSVNMQGHSNDGSERNTRARTTITQPPVKGSPLPSTSASEKLGSPHLPHCHCHSHVQHHHHHHLHHHVTIHPPLSQSDLTLGIEKEKTCDDKDANEEEMEDGLPLHKPGSSAEPILSSSGTSDRSSARTIQGTTQETMTADNVDEIVQDHDNFGTDENEDSLDSVATLSLNETTTSQEDEEGTNHTSFQFEIKIKKKKDTMTPNLCALEAEESLVESHLDISAGLSGTKRKPDECPEDVSGPSNVKKKRTTIISRSNSTINIQASSLLKTTPTSAPRTSHTNPICIGTRGVSDVNMASTAFHLDDDEHDHEEGVDGCKQDKAHASKLDERNEGRSVGRQRYWSAGTLHTEEEICSVTSNPETNFSSNVAQTKLDPLDIVPDLSTCETVALALPCSISTSKNVFANAHNLCRSTNTCCKYKIQPCSNNSSTSERICLSEHEEKKSMGDSSFETSMPYTISESAVDDDATSSNHDDVELCDQPVNECYTSDTFPSSIILHGSSQEPTSGNSFQHIHSTQQQQLMKLIPDKNYPPDDILNWKDSFSRWSNAKRLLAIDQLIGMCEPQQVRHMMAVIEPQFQRDFISLLPKELALYVLSFLKPRDLLNAAQTCQYWRILAEDNLLWREKCREAGLGDSVAEMFNARAKAHCKKISNLSGIDYSSWKLGFMREHNIESNWRIRPIRTTKVLKGHDDHVITCLQFSNNKIVSGSDDNTLKVWNASTGRLLRTLVGHTGGVWSSQMEGNIIVSGSTDRSLKVWNADTGDCVHTLYGHTSTVRCMHLHNNLVVSGSRDATLRMWDISSGECLHVLMGHVAAVRCVQYDGRLVVSGAYDYMVKVWNPITEECLHTLSGHTNRVYSLQFDGVHVVSGSLDTSIRVWDVETGSCKHALMGHQSLTSGMELKDNILVSGNADSTVKVWDITNGQCLQTLSGPNKHQSAVTCLQFDSKFVVTSSDDGTVKLWDVKTGEFIRDLVALKSGGSGGVVWRIRASATKLVCAVGSRNGTEETKLLVLDFDAPLEK